MDNIKSKSDKENPMDFNQLVAFVGEFNFRSNLGRELLKSGSDDDSAVLNSFNGMAFDVSVTATQETVIDMYKLFNFDESALTESHLTDKLLSVFISLFTKLLEFENAVIQATLENAYKGE